MVNAFDADATVCRVQLPERLDAGADSPILVFDDGAGMDVDGLRDLWHIGHSSKRDEAVQKRRQRKQIGKFVIGKLATYAIARRITYVTKTDRGSVLAATLDYDTFSSNPTGGGDTVQLDVVELSADVLQRDEELTATIANAEDRPPRADLRRGALDDGPAGRASSQRSRSWQGRV